MEMIKIKHDNKYICNKCGGKNDVAIGDMIEGHITECLTLTPKKSPSFRWGMNLAK